jgi:hypothetical protein
MFSTHQTILASLYKDRLDAEWMWREEEDIDRAEEVNAVWDFDYDEMGKLTASIGMLHTLVLLLKTGAILTEIHSLRFLTSGTRYPFCLTRNALR